MASNWIQDAVREYVGRRLWYGNLVKGQILTPGYYSTGTIAVTFNSRTVQGTGTNWNASLGGLPTIGQSLRAGYGSPIYNIIGIDIVNQVLTLDFPWGMPSQSSTGYFITQYYYSFPNVKYFYSMKNLTLMYRMYCNYSQAFIENYDPSRLLLMFPRLAATMPPDVNGNYQVELWPASNTQQAFPYLAYVQPPNLVDDGDNFPPFMRTEAIKAHAISNALMYRTKDNVNYSENVCMVISERKKKEFEEITRTAEQEDECLWRQDLVLAEEMQGPFIDPETGSWRGGAMLDAMTEVMPW